MNLPVDLVLPTRTNRCNPINFIKEYNRWTHLICLQIQDGRTGVIHNMDKYTAILCFVIY